MQQPVAEQRQLAVELQRQRPAVVAVEQGRESLSGAPTGSFL